MSSARIAFDTHSGSRDVVKTGRGTHAMRRPGSCKFGTELFVDVFDDASEACIGGSQVR